MEMIPDSKPPTPYGKGRVAKIVKAIIFVVLVGGIFLYFKYPPLSKYGSVGQNGGSRINVYIGESRIEGGEGQLLAYVDRPDIDTDQALLALAVFICEKARTDPKIVGARGSLAPNGHMTVRVVEGGRYLYRLFSIDDWEVDYKLEVCSQSPYLSGELAEWTPNRYINVDDNGETELQIWFRWEGQGERPDFPMKEVCERVMLNPPRQLRALINEDFDTITIFAEWGSFGALEFSSWRSQSFNRVNNLCLEFGPAEEEA